MNNKRESILGVVGMVIFLIIVIGIIAMESNACDGTLVSGLVWFECVKDAN